MLHLPVEEFRGLVEWRRIPRRRGLRPSGSPVLLVAAARLARTRADLVHTLGAIVPNAADLASVHFCTRRLRRVGRPRWRRPTRRPSAGEHGARAPVSSSPSAGRTAATGSLGLGAVSRGVARELARNFPESRPC